MSKFELCTRAGLDIKEQFYREDITAGLATRFINDKVIKAEDVEAFLSKAITVYGFKEEGLWIVSEQPDQQDTHSMRLIMIEPIKQKSREEKLEEMLVALVDDFTKYYPGRYVNDEIEHRRVLNEQAKALLEEKDE